MRNLIQLLWKNNYLILFLLLLFFCLYIVFKTQYYQQAVFINSSNTVVGNVLAKVNSVEQYLSLVEKNENIHRQNVELLLRDSISKFYTKTNSDTTQNSELIQQYVYTIAKVINNSVHRSNNYITLNRGSINGIERDMGVAGPNGVVGVVKDVSPHFCTVLSLLHKDWKLNGKLKKSGEFGPVVWDGKPLYATLTEIPTSSKIAKGDTVVTTSFSTIFPEGIHLGYVTGNVTVGSGGTLSVEMKLATNFYTLSEVYVITNRLKAEQKQLEFKTDSTNAD